MKWFRKYCRIWMVVRTRARVTFSIIWYLVSAAWSVRLTKYTDHSSFSTFWTSAALTASWEIARYTIMGCSGLGFWMTTGDDKKFFSFWKISSHFSSRLNLATLQSSCTIGLVLLVSRGTNLESAVRRPINCWTSFMLWGLHILATVRHLSGLASIPLWVSMKPKKISPSTLNVHFSGLSLMFVRLRALKTYSRSSMCC